MLETLLSAIFYLKNKHSPGFSPSFPKPFATGNIRAWNLLHARPVQHCWQTPPYPATYQLPFMPLPGFDKEEGNGAEV